MSNRPVKVRFCPSPTGTPHVGLIRTALYNWAYAKHMGGSFLFRIEDTDAERDTEESFNAILDAMNWLGLTPDEGVGAGGDNGPYRQSERSDIYKGLIEKLLDAGYLYESYSTKDEIDARNIAAGRPIELGYDNFDRNLTDAERAAFKSEGREPVLRVRVEDEDITFTDLVRGEITFPAGSFSDFVVVRKGGAPLYTFVNPVDDALMGVTHVLRGEDLLSSTPRQITLYRALIAIGATDFVPEFGHMPYITGNGNKKLAKRDPEANLFNHRDAGFIREGLLNYLALLGWSISGDRDVFSMDEMVDAFDIHDVNPNPARFDEKKAMAINAEHIRLLDDDALYERLLPVLVAKGNLFVTNEPTEDEKGMIRSLVPALKTRLRVLSEAYEYVKPVLEGSDFTPTDHEYSDSDKENIRFAIDILNKIPAEDFTVEGIGAAFAPAIESHETISNKTLWVPVRWALVDRKNSLPLNDVMATLGKGEALSRLGLAL